MKEFYYIDSSDDEFSNFNERQQVEKLRGKEGFAEYLIENFKLTDVDNSKEFKKQLGVVFQYFADRIARSKVMNNAYQQLKEEKLSLKGSHFTNIINELKEAFKPNLTKLFIIKDLNKIKDKEYINLFNWLFNNEDDLPTYFKIKNKFDTEEVKQELLSILRDSDIDFKFLNVPALNVSLNEEKDASKFLASIRLFNRSNKNKIKFITLKEKDALADANHLILDNTESGNFIDHLKITIKNKNVSHHLPELTNYENILQNIPFEEGKRTAYVNYIYDIVRGKTPNLKEYKKILSNGDINHAESLVHLLYIIEAQRNNATILSTPMFLDLVKKNANYLDKDYFPMALDAAVASSRAISNKFSEVLPNSFTLDYDLTNSRNSDQLLIAEGELLIEWDKIYGSNKIETIGKTFDLISLIDVLRESEESDLTIMKIDNYIKGLYSIGYGNQKITKSLENKLKVFGNISELRECYRSNKDNAIKKVSSKALSKHKNLVQNIFSDFEDIKDKQLSLMNKIADNNLKLLEPALKETLNKILTNFKDWYNIDLSNLFSLDTLDIADEDFSDFPETILPLSEDKDVQPRKKHKGTDKPLKEIAPRAPLGDITNTHKSHLDNISKPNAFNFFKDEKESSMDFCKTELSSNDIADIQILGNHSYSSDSL
jgi:hypothetical protein